MRRRPDRRFNCNDVARGLTCSSAQVRGAVFLTSPDRQYRVSQIAFAMLVVVLSCDLGCGRETPISVSGGGGDESGQSLGGGPDASAAPDSNAARTRSGGWINRTQGTLASGQEWLAVASDAAGQHLVAVSSSITPAASVVSGVWASTNGGSSWAHVGEANGHASVASNAAGTVFITAGGRDGIGGDEPIWELTSSGATWALMGLGLGASSVASDETGTHFVAGSETGVILTSSNSGASWTNHTPSGPAQNQNWISVASSSTGTKLVALSGGVSPESCSGGCSGVGDIWTSTDSGVTWIDRTPSTGPVHDALWTSVASDLSGMNLVAVGSGIWTSTDAGLTWTLQADPSGSSGTSSSVVWASVASDATGKRLVAATFGDPGSGGTAGGGGGFVPERSGYIFTSTDGGVTWTNETAGTAAAGQNWMGVASDSSGAHLVAIANLGDVWTN
jgi:hypothetical protein